MHRWSSEASQQSGQFQALPPARTTTSFDRSSGRRIIRWPDFDTPGGEQTRKAAEAFERLGGTSVEITWGTEVRDDAFDFFARGNAVEQLQAMVDVLPRLNGNGKLVCRVCSHVKAKLDSELPREVEATHTVESYPLCNDCVKDAQSRQLLLKYGPDRSLKPQNPTLALYVKSLEAVQKLLSPC